MVRYYKKDKDPIVFETFNARLSWECLGKTRLLELTTLRRQDMSQNVAECLADISVRSTACQRPGGGTDVYVSAGADISSNADMSSMWNHLNEITLIGFYRLTADCRL